MIFRQRSRCRRAFSARKHKRSRSFRRWGREKAWLCGQKKSPGYPENRESHKSRDSPRLQCFTRHSSSSQYYSMSDEIVDTLSLLRGANRDNTDEVTQEDAEKPLR